MVRIKARVRFRIRVRVYAYERCPYDLLLDPSSSSWIQVVRLISHGREAEQGLLSCKLTSGLEA